MHEAAARWAVWLGSLLSRMRLVLDDRERPAAGTLVLLLDDGEHCLLDRIISILRRLSGPHRLSSVVNVRDADICANLEWLV